MQWQTFGETTIYDSPWVRLATVDVDIPGHGRVDHHVIRTTAQASGCVIADPDRGILMLWRHRFITNTWGWEVPAGRIDGDESARDAAAREALEETGWQPGPLRHLVSFHPSNGLTDQTFHRWMADSAEYVGDPSDPSESERIAWLPAAEVHDLITSGGVVDSMSLVGLLYAFSTGAITR